MLEPLPLTRVVSTAAALDNANFPNGALVLRTAPDEALVIGEGAVTVDDPHAIVVEDHGWSGGWLSRPDAERFLAGACAWELPTELPALAQGKVADAPAKLWVEAERVLFVVPHVAARDFQERMSHE